MVYDALWDVLERHAGFARLFRVANRIKLTGDNRAPFKDTVQAGDLPEARLVPRPFVANMNASSSDTSVVMEFELQISTGDQRLGDGQGGPLLFQVEFETLRAFIAWSEVLDTLRWGTGSDSFVTHCELFGIQNGVTDADLNRGIKGWSGLVGLRVHLMLLTSDLMPEV